jgi:hypothetical protein
VVEPAAIGGAGSVVEPAVTGGADSVVMVVVIP